MDITNFMTWFIQQVVKIFTFVYSTLAGITFMGTNLLQVILTITILGAILPVFLTIVNTQTINTERRERQKAIQESRRARKGRKSNDN